MHIVKITIDIDIFAKFLKKKWGIKTPLFETWCLDIIKMWVERYEILQEIRPQESNWKSPTQDRTFKLVWFSISLRVLSFCSIREFPFDFDFWQFKEILHVCIPLLSCGILPSSFECKNDKTPRSCHCTGYDIFHHIKYKAPAELWIIY